MWGGGSAGGWRGAGVPLGCGLYVRAISFCKTDARLRLRRDARRRLEDQPAYLTLGVRVPVRWALHKRRGRFIVGG